MYFLEKMKKRIFGETTMETTEIMTNQENEYDVNLDEVTTESLELKYKTKEEEIEERKEIFKQMTEIQLRDEIAGTLLYQYSKKELIDFLAEPERVSIKFKRAKYKPKKAYGSFTFETLEDAELCTKRANVYRRTLGIYCVFGFGWGWRRVDVLNLTYLHVKDHVERCKKNISYINVPFVSVNQKTGKKDEKYFTERMLLAAQTYLDELENGIICNTDNIDFTSKETPLLWNKNGKPFDLDAVNRGFDYLNKTYYGNVPGFSSHLCRRSYGTINKNRGVSIDSIRREFNHKSEEQTNQYIKSNAEEKKRMTVDVL